MPLATLGLSHKSAPVEVRERVVFDEARLPGAIRELLALPGVQEAAVISTCNRTEIYANLTADTPIGVLQQWLETSHHLPAGSLTDYLYRHRGDAMVIHLLTVASGLDSMVLGEPQILGQVKSAYHHAAGAGGVRQTLDRLFQHAFAVAKEVRTRTEIGAHPVSVAYAAVSLARQIFDDMQRRTALLIGAGETIELTARHLRELELQRLIIANRSPERAQRLADQHGAEAVDLDAIPGHLTDVDIVVASTASPTPVLSRSDVERALRQRKHRPMFLVDIAVPRDIEPSVSSLPDVYLYTVDDLREVIDDSLRSRHAAAEQARAIIRLQAQRFREWLRTLDAVDGIRTLRREAELTRQAMLERARRRLAAGEDPEVVMEALSRALTRKLLHAPTVGLREAARTGDRAVIEVSRRLLGLEADNNDDDDAGVEQR
jgi:glutamyl-tRNA reductase